MVGDLIGRDAELDRVRSALGADRAIVVAGEPGIGKTALVRAAADQVTEAMARGEIEAAFGTPALGVAVRHFAGGKILIPASMLWPGW